MSQTTLWEIGGGLENALDVYHDKVSKIVAKWWHVSIVFMLTVSAICSIGLMNMQEINLTETLWAPKHSTSRTNAEFVDHTFGLKQRGGAVLFKATPGQDLLSIASFDAMFDVHEQVMAEVHGDGLAYSDLCIQKDPQGRCMQYGVLQFFNGNRTYFHSKIKNKAQLISAISQPTFPDGVTAVLRDQIFGDFVVNPTNKAIMSAQGMLQFYWINPLPHGTAMAWEKSLSDTIDDRTSSKSNVEVYHMAQRDLDDALGDAGHSDLWLYYITFALVVVFTFYQLTRKLKVGNETRLGLSVVGLCLIMLSLTAGFGVCAGLNGAIVPQHLFVPLFVVPIGINCLFLITSAFDAQDPSLPVDDRINLAMRRCGKGITYTSFAIFTALYLAAMGKFMAVRTLCVFTATCVVFNYFLMYFVFVPCLKIDALRMDSNLLDVLCFVNKSVLYPQSEAEGGVVRTQVRTSEEGVELTSAPPATVTDVKEVDEENQAALVGVSTVPATPDRRNQYAAVNASENTTKESRRPRARRVEELNYLEYFFGEIYFPLLATPWLRILIVCSYIAILAGVGIYGATKLKTGFEVTELMDDGTMKRFVQNARPLDLFTPEQSNTAEIVMGELPYNTQATQIAILHMQTDFLNSTEYNKGPFISWMTAFQQFQKTAPSPLTPMVPGSLFAAQRNAAGYITNPVVFYKALQLMLATPKGARFRADLKFSNGTNGYITESRVTAFHVNLRGSDNVLSTMDNNERLMDATGITPTPFVNCQAFVKAEGYKIAGQQVSNYLVSALIALAILTFLTFHVFRLWPILVAVGFFVMIEVEVLGNMHLWDMKLRLNTGTVPFLALSLMWAFEYTLHILHHYTALPAESMTQMERLKDTLIAVVPSMFMGVLTMLVAIIPLAFASSYTWRAGFRFFFSTLIFAGGNGIILLPAVLPTISWLLGEVCLSPSADSPTFADKNEANDAIPPAAVAVETTPSVTAVTVSAPDNEESGNSTV